MHYKNISLSLKLTLIRFAGGLFIFPFFLVYLLPLNHFFINVILAFLFLCLGATDFFDGYFARKYNQVTAIGATLDHLADKCLLFSTLLALVHAHKIYFLWAIVWIGREFLIMGLRILALENNFTIAVSSFGKSKTVVQIMCLAFIIGNSYQQLGMDALWWNGTELCLLTIGTILSILSAYNYGVIFLQQFKTIGSSYDEK